MRLIHTSDWHLGQYFFTKSRAAEHRAFLNWLIEQIEQQQVDALIVAGDLFDTGSPPSYARELYNRFVVELQRTGCQLVVLGGNHDSVATLNESRELLSCLNTTVIASAQGSLEQQIVVLNRRDGQPGAVLCAIPFCGRAICSPAAPANPARRNSRRCRKPSPNITKRCIRRPVNAASGWACRCRSSPPAT